MISPHTPPGTKVVCINAVNCLGFLNEGEVYTAFQISEGRDGNPASPQYGQAIIGVVLAEVPRGPLGCVGFGLQRFRRADLPRCLTELLEPVNLPREALV